jgi:hemerythrin-like metal-binding protein
MSILNWSDALSVNIKELDQQHQCLIEIINKLHDSMKSGKGDSVIGPILSDLLSYTQFHFSTEEKYFQQFAYPHGLMHKKQHNDLTKKAKDLKVDFDKGKITISIEVMNFLKDWLKDHILGSDKQYAPFLNSKGLS